MLDLPESDSALLADEESDAAIHVTNWGLRPDALQGHLDKAGSQWKAVMGIRATGREQHHPLAHTAILMVRSQTMCCPQQSDHIAPTRRQGTHGTLT